MRIYKINIEHKRFGRNWSSEKFQGRTFDEAVKAAKRGLNNGERIESVELLASTD
jgi:hypothetical protein